MKIDRLLSLTLRLQSIFDFEILFSKKECQWLYAPVIDLGAVLCFVCCLCYPRCSYWSSSSCGCYRRCFRFLWELFILFVIFRLILVVFVIIVVVVMVGILFPERSPLPTLDCFSLCASFFFLRYLVCILPPRPPKPHCVSIIDFPKSEFPAQYIA